MMLFLLSTDHPNLPHVVPAVPAVPLPAQQLGSWEDDIDRSPLAVGLFHVDCCERENLFLREGVGGHVEVELCVCVSLWYFKTTATIAKPRTPKCPPTQPDQPKKGGGF